MTEQAKCKFGHLPSNQNKVIKLRPEPAEWEVSLDIDIPQHKQESPDVQCLLENLAHAIEQRVLSDVNLNSVAKALGVKLVGVRIEKC